MTIDELKSFAKSKGIILPPLQSSKYLTSVISELKDDEELLFFCQAKEGKIDGTLLITSKRVSFLKIAFLSGVSSVSMNIDKINSVSKKKGMLTGELEIWDNSGNVIYSIASGYLDTVENCINQAKKKVDSPKTTTVNQVSAADEILKFKNLLDQGIITQEEFDKKKKELLGV
ncbi:MULTISPECIES: SHOCT domain-containing protein [Fusobacterium]|mgnify:FL=1|uniref:SHOCT domain-containing protein n=1 Tax=Fusobacterium TaxID=848 RepID=UPI0028D5A2B2|nr:SHOCT domain-containing protein [Fusobacterium pseudoperiodonticum]